VTAAAAAGGAEGRCGPRRKMGATVRILGNGLLAAPAYPVDAPDHIHANVGLGEFEIFGDAAKGPAVRAVHGLQHTHAIACRTEDGHCSTTVEPRLLQAHNTGVTCLLLVAAALACWQQSQTHVPAAAAAVACGEVRQEAAGR
jgi:hypothetical protein